jgi:ADP-ribose pyrophosphatase YjhB (NUDIX family)
MKVNYHDEEETAVTTTIGNKSPIPRNSVIHAPIRLQVVSSDEVNTVPATKCSLSPQGSHIKPPPLCRLESIKRDNMTYNDLSKLCYEFQTIFPPSYPSNNTTNVPLIPQEWITFKESLLSCHESRAGRDCQRFATDPTTGNVMRLVTGSVPILSDGRILLVSSGRGNSWILPKGGWESDEPLEFSAMRETFEEAGILGTFGPQLTVIEYEKRKAKKRRLEMETTTSLTKKYDSSAASLSGGSSAYHSEEEVTTGAELAYANISQKPISSPIEDEYEVRTKSPSPPHKPCISSRIRDTMACSSTSIQEKLDEISVASTFSIVSDISTSCTHIRMLMFPVYVLEVREHWPESGRARKAVDIDTAIEMMSNRPEFQQVLIEVKEKGYHLQPHKRIHNIERNYLNNSDDMNPEANI